MTALLDCHLHTCYSGDGHEQPEAMIERAIALGMRHICITDHMDLQYYDPRFPQFDKTAYLEHLRRLQKKYEAKLYVAVGLEVGFTHENRLANAQELQGKDFDYIIDSVHQVGAFDCYAAGFYEGRTQTEVYRQYLTAVLESLSVPYPIHAVGHIGYVFRNAPYAERCIRGNEFDDILLPIFQKMIARNVILELNTSVGGTGVPTLPNPELVQKYRDAGGKLVCFSSDAHDCGSIGRGYEGARQTALRCGFTHWTVVQRGDLVPYKL